MERSLAAYNHLWDRATQTDMSFTQTEPLRPQLFVTRQNGTMVPLVAVDELPSTMSIRGVPRILSPHEISGMTGVGTFNSRHRQYVIDGLNRGYEIPPSSGDRSLMGSSFSASTTRPLKNDLLWGKSRTPTFPTPSKAYGIQEQPPSNPTMPFSNMPPSTQDPSTPAAVSDLPAFHNLDELPIGRAPGIKEYCSYWLRHGECDYAQQGCLYRHEMPLDQSTLEKLGLRDIPRWYREKHRLGSYLAGGNTMSGMSATSHAKPGLMERNWRSHPAEVLAEGTSRKPQKEFELPTTSKSSPTEQKCTKSSTSTSHTMPAKPIVLTPKSTYHGILSRHQPASPKAKATMNVPEAETVSARQMRETIRMLDVYDQRERDRLSEKYQTLEPQKGSPAVPVNTPNTRSTTTASSTSGGTEMEDAAEEVVVSKVKLGSKSAASSSVATSTSLCPKPASLRPTPVGKKRTGKPKRRGNHGRENGSVTEGRETMKVDMLMDHA